MDYLFIVNPVSGGIKTEFPEVVKRKFNSSTYEIVYTEYPGHATELARNSDKSVVVAVGGDGTVNEVAKGLLGTGKILGIIPCGSGNGLAYHLGIPKGIDRALDIVALPNVMHMDVGYINGHLFLCTCGIGLDADVSMLFAKSKRRGLVTYVVDALKAWKSYKYQECNLTIDDASFKVSPTLITIGNANQWGNNAYITPLASVSDGRLDVSVISRISLWNVPGLAYRLLAKTLYHHKKVSNFKASTIDIHREGGGPAHYDGEPLSLGKDIHISVVHEALAVVVKGNKYEG